MTRTFAALSACDGLLARAWTTATMPVGEKHCGRTRVPGILGQARRFDERVVDASAFGRGRSLRDGRRELTVFPS